MKEGIEWVILTSLVREGESMTSEHKECTSCKEENNNQCLVEQKIYSIEQVQLGILENQVKQLTTLVDTLSKTLLATIRDHMELGKEVVRQGQTLKELRGEPIDEHKSH